jgi:hypothetical protein
MTTQPESHSLSSSPASSASSSSSMAASLSLTTGSLSVSSSPSIRSASSFSASSSSSSILRFLFDFGVLACLLFGVLGAFFADFVGVFGVFSLSSPCSLSLATPSCSILPRSHLNPCGASMVLILRGLRIEVSRQDEHGSTMDVHVFGLSDLANLSHLVHVSLELCSGSDHCRFMLTDALRVDCHRRLTVDQNQHVQVCLGSSRCSSFGRHLG